MRNPTKSQAHRLRKLRPHPSCRRPLRVGCCIRRATSLIACLWGAWIGIRAHGATPTETWPQPTQALEEALYRFDFAQADSLVNRLSDPRCRLLYQAHSLFLQHMMHPSARTRTQHEALATQTLATPSSDAGSFITFMQAEILLQSAAIRLLAGETWSALWHLKRCWHRVEALRPSQHPAPKRLSGLFEVCLSAVPERYQWFLKWLGLNGNLTTGTNQLQKAAQANTFFSAQAKVLLFYTYRSLHGRNDWARALAESCQEAEKSHVLWNYLLAQLAIERMAGEEAEKYLKSILCQAPNFPFVWWLAGRVALGKGELIVAHRYLASFVKFYCGRLYLHDANLRLGVIAQLHSQKVTTQAKRQKIQALPEPLIDEDRSAARFSAIWLAPNLTTRDSLWLRVRMAIDGGWAAIAQQHLNTLKNYPLDADEKTEWHYRTARILDKTGQRQAALVHYQQARQHPATANLWMKVAALLHEGLIYEESHAPQAAENCYKLILRYSNYPYQASIEQKALAGLQRISKQTKTQSKLDQN